MKKVLITSAFLHLTSYLLFAQPYTDNNDAVAHRAKGIGISYTELPEKSKIWAHGLDFTCWNGNTTCGNGYAIGSQNHPVMAAMGWGDYHWIAELCRYEKAHGIFGRELGAPAYYFANVIASKIVALRDARAAGNYTDAKDICESLRCTWAYDALVAAATPRKTNEINLAGKITTDAGDASWYDGLTVASAGERWHTEQNLDHDTHGQYLSWAIDWPRHDGTNNLLTSHGGWLEENTANCTGVPYYTQTTDPEVFGINSTERQKLQDVINGDLNAAKWAAQVVANFGAWKDPNYPYPQDSVFIKLRIRRTTLGAEMVWFNSVNGNKPTHAAAQIFNDGTYKAIRPGYYHGTGANSGYSCWISNGIIYADCPNDGNLVSLPEMGGNILWEINIDGPSVIFNGQQMNPAGQASYPTGPDVGVTAVINPTSTISTTTVTPKVTVKNYSNTTVNVLYISYQLNNGPMWTTTWRGTFAAGATMNVNLWNAPVSPGNYTLKVFTGGPNYEKDANTSNDSQTTTFVVGSATVLDAGVTTIVNPTATMVIDTLKPVATVKNYGNTNLTSVSVRYKLDGGPAVIFPWSGTLAPNASVNVNLPFTPITAGTHTIQIFTVNPNAQADANTGNDSQTLVFDVTSAVMTDVLAVSLGEPLNLGCATTISPLFVLKNSGSVELDKVTIDYSIDGGPVVSRTYSVTAGNGLQPGKAMGLHGNASTVSVGMHTIKIWSTLPNSVADADNNNDTLIQSFTVAGLVQTLPFKEDFENVNAGNIPANWTLYNRDAFDEWFVYAMTGNKAAAFHNYVYTGAVNEPDYLTLPVLDFTGNSSVWLTFDLAHASRPNSVKFDSLEVSISTDCDATFTSIWSAGGPSLNTTFDDSAVFIPAGPQDYKNIQVNLTNYVYATNAIVRFTNWSNNNNSTLIDNVNILPTPATGVSENNSEVSLNVFPNPAKDHLDLFGNFSSGETKIELINVLGEKVLTENIVLNADGRLNHRLDISKLVAGIYNIVITSQNKMSEKKVMVIR